MRFRLLSDLHLEFENNVLDFSPTEREDDEDSVLILAGDIGVGVSAYPFIEKMCRRFQDVVYVLGNHEFYHNEYNDVRSRWDSYRGMASNFHLLDDDSVVLGDYVRVIGGTLWTDFDNEDWFSMNQARQGMNDFNCVKYKERPGTHGKFKKRSFLPQDAVRAHKATRTFINEELRKPFSGPTVVVTHHLPHPLCSPERFRGSALNAAYLSNLNEMFEENDIAVWCHGHTHDNVDIEVHDTRILCNPRGYAGHDLNHEFDELLTFDL